MLETRSHLGEHNRFSQEGKPAEPTATRLHLAFGDGCGQEHDRHPLQTGTCLKTSGQVSASHSWHHHVQQDQAGQELLGGSKSGSGVVYLADDVMVGLFEIEFQQPRIPGIVVHHQDFLFVRFHHKFLGSFILNPWAISGI